jgi:hypothetical protein
MSKSAASNWQSPRTIKAPSRSMRRCAPRNPPSSAYAWWWYSVTSSPLVRVDDRHGTTLTGSVCTQSDCSNRALLAWSASAKSGRDGQRRRPPRRPACHPSCLVCGIWRSRGLPLGTMLALMETRWHHRRSTARPTYFLGRPMSLWLAATWSRPDGHRRDDGRPAAPSS